MQCSKGEGRGLYSKDTGKGKFSISLKLRHKTQNTNRMQKMRTYANIELLSCKTKKTFVMKKLTKKNFFLLNIVSKSLPI